MVLIIKRNTLTKQDLYCVRQLVKEQYTRIFEDFKFFKNIKNLAKQAEILARQKDLQTIKEASLYMVYYHYESATLIQVNLSNGFTYLLKSYGTIAIGEFSYKQHPTIQELQITLVD